MKYDRNIVGWMTEPDLDACVELASSIRPHQTILELGSLFGRSTVAFAMNAPETARIVCVDTFEQSHTISHTISNEVCRNANFPINGTYNVLEEFNKNTARFNNITKVTGRSPEQITFGEPIDLFFMDTAHVNPNDWDNILYYGPLINVGGWISGHDYQRGFPDVITNADILSKYLGQPVKVWPRSTVWAIKVTRKINAAELNALFLGT